MFFFIILLQLRWPIESKFSQVCYFMHMLGYTKWEYWSLRITKCVQAFKRLRLGHLDYRLVLSVDGLGRLPVQRVIAHTVWGYVVIKSVRVTSIMKAPSLDDAASSSSSKKLYHLRLLANPAEDFPFFFNRSQPRPRLCNFLWRRNQTPSQSMFVYRKHWNLFYSICHGPLGPGPLKGPKSCAS